MPQSSVENNQRNPLCFNALEVAFIHVAPKTRCPLILELPHSSTTAPLLPRAASVQPPQTTWMEAEAGAPRLLYWPSALCHRWFHLNLLPEGAMGRGPIEQLEKQQCMCVCVRVHTPWLVPGIVCSFWSKCDTLLDWKVGLCDTISWLKESLC